MHCFYFNCTINRKTISFLYTLICVYTLKFTDVLFVSNLIITKITCPLESTRGLFFTYIYLWEDNNWYFLITTNMLHSTQVNIYDSLLRFDRTYYIR